MLKFTRVRDLAEFVAETPTAIYRVARGPLGHWTVKVDGSRIGDSHLLKREAIAEAQNHADNEAALKARAKFMVIR